MNLLSKSRGLLDFYSVSYLYFGAMATCSVVLVGLIVSYATGQTQNRSHTTTHNLDICNPCNSFLMRLSSALPVSVCYLLFVSTNRTDKEDSDQWGSVMVGSEQKAGGGPIRAQSEYCVTRTPNILMHTGDNLSVYYLWLYKLDCGLMVHIFCMHVLNWDSPLTTLL